MKDKHEEIARALLGLTSRERATAVMREVYGMSDEEIEPLVGRLTAKGAPGPADGTTTPETDPGNETKSS